MTKPHLWFGIVPDLDLSPEYHAAVDALTEHYVCCCMCRQQRISDCPEGARLSAVTDEILEETYGDST